ncbi:MAG: AAA family ATPase [Candidatus Thorarchaeota archaeon]
MPIEIKKATDYAKGSNDNYMIVGPPGSGKSKLVGTFPGKTLVLCFDPSAGDAYAGLEHVDIVEYRLDSMNIGLAVKRDGPSTTINVGEEAPTLYVKFGEDLQDLVNNKLYANYNQVVVDSATTFEAMERDFVMHKNGTYGHVPKMDDHNLTANQTSKIFRMLTNLPVSIIFVVHDALEQDVTSKRLMNQLMLTGKVNRRMLPSLFNHIMRTEVDQVRTQAGAVTKFFLVTQSDKTNPFVRTSYTNLDSRVDVTIGDFKNPQAYGMGKIIKEQA